jgi:hypothetical protein
MLTMEEVLCELSEHEKKNEQGLPPGFRFHPTDEELITFYLASKVFKNTCFNNVKFAEVDLNRCEPWELPGTYLILFTYFLLKQTYSIKKRLYIPKTAYNICLVNTLMV